MHSLRRAGAVLLLCGAGWVSPAIGADGDHGRALFRGVPVEFVERGGQAIVEGDMVLGPVGAARASLEQLDDTASARRNNRPMALVDPAASLWPASGGTVDIPYVFEAGSRSDVDRAVAQFNETFAGLIRWVPRNGQPDYVAFRFAGESGGPCFSNVGRIGGRQEIGGDPACPAARVLHEMGHAIGLLHTQSDTYADRFVDIYLDRIVPGLRWASVPTDSGRRFGGYDYRSIMHYTRQHFAMFPDPVTLETRPAGMDVGLRDGFSAGDIDAVRRLYGAVPTAVTISTNPPGLRVRVDGLEFTTPAQFNWPIGSQHQLDIPAGLQTRDGFSFAFGRWSQDASTSPSTALTWVVAPGTGVPGQPAGAPDTTLLTANFVRLIAVNSVLPATGGQMSVTADTPPWSGTTNLYPNYTRFTLSAQPQGTRQALWDLPRTGAISGGLGGALSATLRITEELPVVALGGSFADAPGIVVNTSGPGITSNISARWTRPDATSSSVLLPFVQPAGSGSYRLSVDTPQMIGTEVRFVLDGIDGLDDAATGTVAAPATATFRTVNVRMKKQLRSVTERNPACGGSLQLSDAGPWHTFGQALTATATPSAGIVFSGWSGTVSGTATTVNVNVGDAIPEIVANFNTMAEPLALARISQSSAGSSTFDVAGSGMIAGTQLTLGNKVFTLQVIDSRHARATLAAADLAAPATAYLSHNISAGCTVFSETLRVDASILSAADYSDMWWVGAQENGWGVSITQHGDIQFIVIYAYDAAGKPVWYVLPGGSWNADHTAYTGSLYVPTSAPFDAYTPASFRANAPVGSATIRYSSSSVATLNYTINGISGSKNIQRQVFGNTGEAAPLVVKDLWWGGQSQDGWGVNIAQQGNTLFPVWYTYDATGSVVWFVVPGGVWNGSTFTGDMYSTRGSPWLGAAYDPASLVVTKVGTMVLVFSSANQATMTYTVNGVTQSKPIVRQPF